jgi:elongation factor P
MWHDDKRQKARDMKINGNEVRPGMVIEYEGKLCLALKNQTTKPGKGGAYNQVELRDVKTGTKHNARFSSSENVERAEIFTKPFDYLYDDGTFLNLMNNETYDQIQVDKELVGDMLPFLQEGMTVSVGLHDDEPISIKLPDQVVLQVADTEAVVKGQTASSSYKPATMENGVRVLVPPYISVGEKIVVRTEDASFVERYKA